MGHNIVDEDMDMDMDVVGMLGNTETIVMGIILIRMNFGNTEENNQTNMITLVVESIVEAGIHKIIKTQTVETMDDPITMISMVGALVLE